MKKKKKVSMFTVLIPHRVQSTCGWLKAAVSRGYLTFFFYIQKEKKTKNQKPQQG